MIALKIGSDVSASPSGELVRSGFFEQIVEFFGPKPAIHFAILSADADPTGDKAHAACVAAKEPPGELALVAFSLHSMGADQVLVRKEWYESALVSSVAKFPRAKVPTSTPLNVKSARQIPQAPSSAPRRFSFVVPPGRPGTPSPSEENELVLTTRKARASEAERKSAKGNTHRKVDAYDVENM